MNIFQKTGLLVSAFGIMQLAQAACVTAPEPGRYFINGKEATDVRTGLIWHRCTVGQTWNETDGKCLGLGQLYDHQSAQLFAAAQTGWRLPNRRELLSIVEHGCTYPSLDSSVFFVPENGMTQGSKYWTSTPYAREPINAWVVFFNEGVVHTSGRMHKTAMIRLVRTP